jgi:hypothetical protein
MAVDSSGLLQGGIAFASNVMKQQELEAQKQQAAAKNALDLANLDRQDAELNMQAQNFKFEHSATLLKQQFEQQSFIEKQKEFAMEYALKKTDIDDKRAQFGQTMELEQAKLGLTARGQDMTFLAHQEDNSIQKTQLGLTARGQDMTLQAHQEDNSIQKAQLGLTARGQDMTLLAHQDDNTLQRAQLGLTSRGQDIQQSQFGQTFGLAQKDSAYKDAMLAFQKDPTNPENMLRMSTIAKNIRDANAPLSDQGKLQQDVNSGLLPQSAVAANAMNMAKGRIPPGYRFTDPTNPASPLEAIPGGPAEKQSPQNAAANAALGEAKRDLDTAKGMLYDSNGNVNRGLLVTSAASIPGSAGRQFNQTLQRSIMSKLRLESGAAISDQELQRYNKMFIPSYWDSADAIKSKMQSLDNFLSNTTKMQAGYLPDKKSTPATSYSDADLAYTAQKNNMTIEQVKAQLGA